MTIPVPILLYHSVSDNVSPKFKTWSVTPKDFDAQLAYLGDRQLTPITVTQLAQLMIHSEAPLPVRPVVVTFDDGLADFYSFALPVLKDHGFAATLYITTGFVGQTSRWLDPLGEGRRPMLTWSQIAEINASGVECGGHSFSHPQLDTLSPSAAWDEIVRCKIALEQHLGQAVTTFAYPHGYYSPVVRRLVQQAGYTSACAVKRAMSATTDDRFALARIEVTADTDLESFGRLLAGQGVPAAPVRERVQTKIWRAVRRSAALLRPYPFLELSEEPDIQGVLNEAAPVGSVVPENLVEHRPPEIPDSDSAYTINERSQTASDAQPPLLLYNLLNNFADLASLLHAELRRRSWLNAYLLAVGVNQIVEDYLHPDPLMVGKSKKYLSRLARPIRAPAVSGAEVARAVLPRLLNQIPSRRYCVRWQIEFATLLADLANLAIAANPIPKLDETLAKRVESILANTDRLPTGLLNEVLRLPSCFRSFDQQPGDLERIVGRFTERWPDRARPVIVIGIRTSGSYLAPLCAAFLKANGFEMVTTLTVRPGRKLLAHEREMLNVVVKTGGLALITDDPPSTGKSLAAAAQELEAFGLPVDSIVLLLQLFGAATTLPPILHKYKSVLLEWEGWRVHEQLAPKSVQAVLSDMFAPDLMVKAVERVPLPERRWVRSHVSACYRVELVQGDHHSERDVFVKGVGLGYFGEHTAVLAERLSSFTPTVFGIRDGLQYRAWLPEAQRVAERPIALSGPALAEVAAQYVFARHRALPVEEDISLKLQGQVPVWEVASDQLRPALRLGWWRIPVIDPHVKRLLAVTQPSVIDGSMGLSNWFSNESPDQLSSVRFVKIDIDERDFSNLDLYCYDPVYDVAGLAASASLSDSHHHLPDQLRNAYEQLSGQAISAERWLLYQLVHLWDQQRNIYNSKSDSTTVHRAYARALQAYFAETFFQDVPLTNLSGPICALDIDGVLESGTLEAPSVTPSSAIALRALLLHSYRVVLATGRSLYEVRERCQAYRLIGGVAEYGAVFYNRLTGKVTSLLGETEVADLERLQSALRADSAIHIDPDYRYSVRAYRIDRTGRRRGLADEAIASVIERAEMRGHIRPIRGQAQTDFVNVGIDKGTGLRAFMAQSEFQGMPRQEKPLAFAVGDTVSDLPMFELAAHAFAPAHADTSVKAAAANSSNIRIVKLPYQRGLAEAVAITLGHPLSGCPVCKSPVHSADTRELLTLLGVQEFGRWGFVMQALALSLNARRH